MRSVANAARYRSDNRPGFFFYAPVVAAAFVFLVSTASAQSVAIIDPAESPQSTSVAASLGRCLGKTLRVRDPAMAESAFRASAPVNPYNLTTRAARDLGNAVGASFLVILRADTLRRSSVDVPEYYESYAAFYLVSSRTGSLVKWQLARHIGKTPDAAISGLDIDLERACAVILASTARAYREETDLRAGEAAYFDGERPSSAGEVRPPLPFRRISPPYTKLADSFSVEATVDIAVEIASDGKVVAADILRWAGFGLDESVVSTVKRMQWRPADIGGKVLPMRILLRYNFRNIESDEN